MNLSFKKWGVALRTYTDAHGETKCAAAVVFCSVFEPHPPLYTVTFAADSAKFLGIRLSDAAHVAGRRCALVKELAPGGQGESSGVEVGSRLVSANGLAINSYDAAMQTVKHLPRPLELVFAKPVGARS